MNTKLFINSTFQEKNNKTLAFIAFVMIKYTW